MSATETLQARLLSSRKNKIIFGAALIGALLVAGLAVYAIVVTPQRQPYRDALAQYNNVYEANVNVMLAGSSLNAGSATNEEFQKSTELVETALRLLQTEHEALGVKDVLKSGEGKELYDAFDTKLAAYISYNTTMLESMQKVRPVIFDCSQKMATVTEDDDGVKEIQSCADTLATLATVPDKDYQTLVLSSQKVYAAFAKSLEKGALLNKEISDEQERILDDLNTVSKTFSENVNKSKQAVDITDTAMALDAYLSKKASIFG